MTRTYGYSVDFDRYTEELFKSAIFLGEGHNGIVYEVPEKRAIKIFLDKKICESEAEILYKVKNSKYFPKIHRHGELYILREMVYGIRLDHYIRQYGLSKNLSINLYNMIEEFKRLKFTKLDARCRDIYINDNEEIKLIDPKQCFTRRVNYPRHLMKGLNNIQVLEQFLNYILEHDSEVAYKWNKDLREYFNKIANCKAKCNN